MKPKTALILCGGQGTRLRPLTHQVPKVLLPVQGRPLLEHNIEALKRQGLERFILSVGHLKEQIKDYFEDGSGLGFSIEYLEEAEPLGTGGPLRLAQERGLLPKKTFIMCNGDELKEVNILKLRRLHNAKKALATIALVEVDDARDWGVVELKGSRILRFVEKPGKGQAPSNLANAGLYLMEPGVADLVPAGRVSLEREVFPKLAEQGRLFGAKAAKQWFPTDTPEKLRAAQKGWKPRFTGAAASTKQGSKHADFTHAR
ncbi:MAG: NDP-sugar synthase [Candidatus Aenigmatarchaeota archaeon]